MCLTGPCAYRRLSTVFRLPGCEGPTASVKMHEHVLVSDLDLKELHWRFPANITMMSGSVIHI